ncbi:MAG: hypothetical protein WBG36_07430 [Ornithinimicrobium sp.]
MAYVRNCADTSTATARARLERVGLAGRATASSGEVLLNGIPTAAIDDWTQISFCPQRIGLAAEFTIAENVMLPCLMSPPAIRTTATRPGLPQP